MGPLERLRQEKTKIIVEKQKTEYAEKEGEEKRKRAEIERQNKEAKFHQDRQEAAQNFYKESGVGYLVSELTSILNAHMNDARPHSFDPDSVFNSIGWERKLGHRRHETKGGFEPTIRWLGTEYEEKAICVEITPTGTIKISGGGFTSNNIEPAIWRRNQNILEEKLVEAHKHPMKFKGLQPPPMGESISD